MPYSRHFSPEEYNAVAQNWSVASDSLGIMYFANNSGVLVYNGLEWKLIPLKNNPVVRSVFIDRNGYIFAGGANEFGFLLPDSTGTLKYYSLSSQLKDSVNFNDIWKIYPTDTSVLFCGAKHIFEYNYDTLKIFAKYEEKGNLFFFYLKKKIYLGNYFSGLLKFENDKFTPLQGAEVLKNKNITSLVEFKGKIVATTFQQGIFVADQNFNFDTAKFAVPYSTNEFLKKSAITSAIVYNNNLILSTYAGIVVLDSNFNISDVIGDKIIADKIVYSVYATATGDVWAALNNGISKVNLFVGLRYLAENQGITTSVYDVIDFKGKIYLATNEGIFKVEKDKFSYDYSTEKIPYDKVLTGWGFTIAKKNNREVLLVATNFGIYEVYEDHLKKIIFNNDESISSIYAFSLLTSKNDSNIVYIGGKKNFYIARFKNNWQFLKTYTINDEIRNITEDNAGNIWLGTPNSGIAGIFKDTVLRFFKNNSYSIPLFFNGKLYVSIQNKLKVFSYKEKTFTDLPDIPLFANASIFNLKDYKGKAIIIAFTKDNKDRFVFYNPEKNSLDTTFLNYLPINSFYNIYFDNRRSLLWIPASKIVFSLKCYPKNVKNKIRVFVRKVLTKGDNLLYGGYFIIKDGKKLKISARQPENFIPEISFKDNSLTFYFSSNYYSEDIVYSYYLEGFDKKWSKWSEENKKSYSYLPAGTYTFKVRAKTAQGFESDVATYTFTVLAPWYLKWWAILIYIVLALILIYVIVMLYNRKLIKEKEKLEQIVAERTKEIRKKNEELEAQNIQIQKQRDLLLQKNKQIEEQNKNIKASITYARRIQEAILPPAEPLKKFVKDFFILFRPRDIVSGDFYWIKSKGDKLFVIAADCTGHGVPGAFMSVLGVSLLNELIEKFPAKSDIIINELRNRVIRSLHQDEKDSETQDGMDMAMIIYDKTDNSIQYSGANNPLLIVRPTELGYNDILQCVPEKRLRIYEHSNGKSVIEIKADKMPVGTYIIEPKPFTSVKFKVNAFDNFYIFSDGYQDQFGGPDRKKFMLRRFKELLAEIYNLKFDEQKDILVKTLDDWRNHNPDRPVAQIDDILVIGLKFN